jgi:two-component system, NarL family, response regulator NreC
MRIALIASEPVFRLGFRALVQSRDDLELVAEASDARTGFQEMAVHEPDVLVMDLFLKGMNGINATRELKRRSPGIRVLLITDWARERDAVEALAAGAKGLALKTDGDEELLDAIRRVHAGQPYVPPAFRRFDLLDPARTTSKKLAAAAIDVLKGLSPREKEVLDLVVRGWRNAAIALELTISIKTVDTYRTRIHRKLGCHNATELIRFAAENDLLDRPVGGRGERSGRTIVLMVDDDPQVRAQIQRDLFGDSCREVHTSDVAKALAELRTSQTASLFVIDDDVSRATPGEVYRQLLADDPLLARLPVLAVFESASRRPPIRAAASLPQGGVRDGLGEILDRVGAGASPVPPLPLAQHDAQAM